MAISEFFTGAQDSDLNKDSALKSGTLLIQRVIQEQSAEYNDATPNGEFILTAGVIVADNDFNSVAPNLEFVDDDGDICSIKISDTVLSTNKISFVIANAKKAKDGTTAAALTDGTFYEVRVLTPTLLTDSEDGDYGKYFGYVSALSFEPVNEKAELKIGIPRKKVLEGDLENGYSVTGEVHNVANQDILKAIFGMAAFGSQTSRFELGWGSVNAARDYYRLFIVSQDEEGRTNVYSFLRGRFTVSGAQDFISDEYKKIAFSFDGLSDGFYPEDADMFIRIREDA